MTINITPEQEAAFGVVLGGILDAFEARIAEQGIEAVTAQLAAYMAEKKVAA